MHRVQIAGLQRSGTRWLAMLMSNNYSVSVHKTGKHDMPGEYPHGDYDAALVIYKRFDHWLNSIIRNPVNVPDRRPELYEGGRLLPIASAELYQRFYTEWFSSERVWPVDYSALLTDPQTTLAYPADHFGWRRNPGPWQSGGPDKLPDWRRQMYAER